jgi:hypothetical protein
MLGEWGWGGFVIRCFVLSYLLTLGAGNIGHPLPFDALIPGGVILAMLSGSGESGWWPEKWRRRR